MILTLLPVVIVLGLFLAVVIDCVQACAKARKIVDEEVHELVLQSQAGRLPNHIYEYRKAKLQSKEHLGDLTEENCRITNYGVVGAIFLVCGVIFLICILLVLVAKIPEKVDVYRMEQERIAIVKSIEMWEQEYVDDVYHNETYVTLMEKVKNFNTRIYRSEYWHDNLWVGWFFKDYTSVEPIDYGEHNVRTKE